MHVRRQASHKLCQSEERITLVLNSLLSEMYMFVNRPGDILASSQEGLFFNNVHYCNYSWA